METCKLEADAWFTRYAKAEGISLSDAKKAAYEADIDELQRKAKYYVANRDSKAIAFSPEANREMRKYNFAMKISRHELLMRNIELALNQMSDSAVSLLGDYLSDMAAEELVRQAGLLGMAISSPEELASRARTIANSSFHDMTFSERIWANQKTLQEQIGRGVTKSIVMGHNPVTWMRTLYGSMEQSFENANYAMKRLAVTESGRVQIEAQEESYKTAGYEEYIVICEPTACEICMPHDGKVYPVNEMQQGVNSPMFHPLCKCSTSAYMDRSEVEDAFAELDRELAEINVASEARQERPVVSGGITGALDPDSKRANDHAERYYESIRKRKNDAKKISNNTGLPEEEIEKVRRYLFVEKHDLGRGVLQRFDHDYRIAESWRRLVEGSDIQPHDLTLLKHEIEERKLVKAGMSQDAAHKEVSKMYNYSKEVDEYYATVKKH